ncbi:MAG: hypothetical protein Q9226_002687, partial [Calogaya cf. arnoldii]
QSTSPSTKPLTTLFRSISFGNNNKDHVQQQGRRNTVDVGTGSVRPAMPMSERSEEKGKRGLLRKRRGSGL